MKLSLALTLLLATAPAQARAAAHPRTSWTFSSDVARRHDDNTLQLTRRRLDQLVATPGSPRFKIVSAGDDVTVAGLDAGVKTRWLPRRETRFTASADLNRYARNTVCDWDEYRVTARQELTASRRVPAMLTLSWSRLPGYYLGEVTDDDESVAAGQRVRRSLTYAQDTRGVALASRFVRGQVGLGAGLERVHRDYNPHFDERDSDCDRWQFDANVEPFRRWGLRLGVVYLTGSLAARGDLASTPIRDADISYDHHGLGLSAGVPWGRAENRGRLDLLWMPEVRSYTTADKFDVIRFGRVNHRRDTTVRVTQHVWGPFDAIGRWERLTSDAGFPSGISFPEEQTDFAQTQTSLALRGRWPVAAR